MYKSISKLIWSYGIQIWGPAKSSNIRPIQAHQNFTLRLITKAPWYISNDSIYKELNITTVKELAFNYYKRLHY